MNLEKVVQLLHPNGELLRAWQPEGGVSAEITALAIAVPGGGKAQYIIRRHGEVDLAGNPDIAALEFNLLSALETEIIPAPRPWSLDTSCQILPTPYLVVEYVQGEVELQPASLPDYLRQFYEQLAAIHRVDPSRVETLGLPSVQLRFYDPKQDSIPGLDLGRIRQILTDAWTGMRVNEPVLLHGDYWPGNLLWAEERLVGVIDWEDARMGDPLADLANSRLEVLWAFGAEAMGDFTCMYQAMMEIDYTHLPYWDLWAVLKPAAKLSSWGLSADRQKEMQAALTWFAQQAFSSKPLG
jgi:aminoglycoside phosphotransferase (APT) family kinase protein